MRGKAMNKMTLGATAQPRYLEYRLDMLCEKEGLFKAKEGLFKAKVGLFKAKEGLLKAKVSREEGSF